MRQLAAQFITELFCATRDTLTGASLRAVFDQSHLPPRSQANDLPLCYAFHVF